MNHAVRCRGLTKVFMERETGGNGFLKLRFWKRKKITAVNSMDFEVPHREIFGIVGPNGSGKSTLVRLLSTLLLPDAGSMEIFGFDVVKSPIKVRQMINRVSVDAAFFKKLSPWENLSYAARLYGVGVEKARDRAQHILERLGFQGGKLDQPLENLSRGMQQMVAVARALMTSPVLLLLDEPTTGLDPKSKRQVQRFILEVRETHDATVIITTHDMNEADRICDRVAIIDQGRFVAIDSPEGLKGLIQGKGEAITLEDVFIELTGKQWEENQP